MRKLPSLKAKQMWVKEKWSLLGGWRWKPKVTARGPGQNVSHTLSLMAQEKQRLWAGSPIGTKCQAVCSPLSSHSSTWEGELPALVTHITTELCGTPGQAPPADAGSQLFGHPRDERRSHVLLDAARPGSPAPLCPQRYYKQTDWYSKVHWGQRLQAHEALSPALSWGGQDTPRGPKRKMCRVGGGEQRAHPHHQ